MTEAKIIGRLIELPGRRSVFVGRSDGTDALYVQFENVSAVRRFCLSEEAASALRRLLGNESELGVPQEYEFKAIDSRLTWQLVKPVNA